MKSHAAIMVDLKARLQRSINEDEGAARVLAIRKLLSAAVMERLARLRKSS